MSQPPVPVPFFIPDLRDDPAAAEQEWARCVNASGAPADSRRVQYLRYAHDGDEFEVEVGQKRLRYQRRKGPRGGHIKNAGVQGYGTPTGTEVSAIIDAGQVFFVWSYGPPFQGWANPSMVGRDEVLTVVHFA